MPNHLLTYFFICVALISSMPMVGAGYTDDLWNESEDREYYDCGDWSGVENAPNMDMRRHYYRYDDDVDHNHRKMFTPETFGLPMDASLVNVNEICDVAWVSVFINGFSHTLHYKDVVYTDDQSDIDFRHDWMECRTFNTKRKWITDDPSRNVSLSENLLIIDTYFQWHNNYDNHGTHVETISKSLPECVLWGTPELEINVTLTEHRGYTVLDVPTPDDVVGIRITANNETSVYEKFSHCLKHNSTPTGFEYCDLIECDHHTFSGIFPYGEDRYLLDGAPSDLSVELFTPFEAHTATIRATVIKCTTDEHVHLKNHSMYALAMFCLPVFLTILLYRRFA